MSETFYDKEIAPELLKLAKKCGDNNMSFVAVVEYEPNERSRTCRILENAGLEMVMINHCAKTSPNIDGYIIGLLHYARENNIKYDSSIVMKRMAGDDDETV